MSRNESSTFTYLFYQFFTNCSSAGAAEASASCMPTNYPGMTPCFNTNRPVGQTSASSGNRIPEAISMSATTPSAAPLLFLPSQHPHQFVPQQGKKYSTKHLFQNILCLKKFTVKCGLRIIYSTFLQLIITLKYVCICIVWSVKVNEKYFLSLDLNLWKSKNMFTKIVLFTYL